MNNNRRQILRVLQIFILVAAFGMLSYGIYRGEVSMVLNKAVNICLECIGLG
ncbi:CD1871A family CXXC motif-containing protein [Faecalicatena contorta]|uniref:CD1871A family CXXC motif-containing protein n=1 Tax=Faecalicatena contorta TaxID=39482 RepID=UPI001F4511E8|nr:CD1871A family CXXC motif-containing protein [Faecalicatena contorta]MCF2682038.1 thioredoxin [Faecalicatena contorta]